MRTTRPPSATAVHLALLALVALIAAACSGDYDRYADLASTPSSTTSPATTTTVPPTTTTVPPGPTTTLAPGATTTTLPLPEGVPPGRLALVTPDGALLTVRADGSDVRTVTDAPAGGTTVQFAWSRDAGRLAFSTTTNAAATIGVGTVDGAPPARQTVITAPYHLAWNADQSSIGYLRVDSVDSIELGVVDAAVAGPPVRLRSGSPVTAAWSPDGRRFIATVGEDELTLVEPSGARRLLDERPAPAGTPAWLDASRVLVAVRTGDDQRLVLLDVDTGARQDLLIYDGVITFLPDGANRIAYQVVPPEAGGGSEGRISYRRQADGDPPIATAQQLTVFDIATGASMTVLDEPADAFQWSPARDRLAFLDASGSGAGRWRFWTPEATVDGAIFTPSESSIGLALPIFDQLAPETSWWSPDGTAFTFAGRVQGREGVWVQAVAGGTAPTFVHDGDLVAWSPA